LHHAAPHQQQQPRAANEDHDDILLAQ
jgi:hypothetical protein